VLFVKIVILNADIGGNISYCHKNTFETVFSLETLQYKCYNKRTKKMGEDYILNTSKANEVRTKSRG